MLTKVALSGHWISGPLSAVGVPESLVRSLHAFMQFFTVVAVPLKIGGMLALLIGYTVYYRLRVRRDRLEAESAASAPAEEFSVDHQSDSNPGFQSRKEY